MNAHAIYRKLELIQLTTDHAQRVKAQALSNLTRYDQAVDAHTLLICLATIGACLAWLVEHIDEIDDTQVLPSQRQWLMTAFSECCTAYDQQKGI